MEAEMSDSESLALSLPEAPAEVFAREVNSKAARAFYGTVASLRAVGRSVKIVRERDRTHGFVAAGLSERAGKERIAAPAQNLLVLPAACPRLQMAPQAVEKAQNEPEIGAPFGPREKREPLTQAKAFIDSVDKSPQMVPQAIEKAQNPPGNCAPLPRWATSQPRPLGR